MIQPGLVRRLLESGQIWTIAAQCETAAELAARIGISEDALHGQLARLRKQGIDAPTPLELLHRARRLGTYGSPVQESSPGLDEWEVEQTARDVAPVIEAARGDIQKVDNRLEPVEEHRLKRRVAELEAENKRLMDEVLNTRDLLGVAREAATYRVNPLEMRERVSGRREAASLVVVSDNHVDEVVTPQSVNGLNEHNPEIARARMARVFEGARWLTNHARQSHLVRDVVLALLGDHISGTIHADLSETNAMSLPESIAFAQQLIGDGIRHLLEDPEVATIRCVCTTGNHGRLTAKPRVHTRNETNAEMILFVSLAREFANDHRVSFDIPTGVFTYFDVYGRTIRASHGDSFRYSGALGGLTNPINRGIARLDQGRRASLTLLGHWHTLFDGGNFIVNGSSIGTGPFSEWIHAPFERPQQAWALLDSKRWRSLSAPIWCDEISESEEAAA